MDQLSELCRVCLASSKRLESLDTEYERGCSLKFMLTSFCTLQMDDISAMYDNTCKDCSSQILTCYNFKLQCEQNDSLLRKKAQALKYEEVCKNEGEYTKGAVDTTIVKKEVDNSPFYEENKHNVPVKQEVCTQEDDHKNSDDHRSSEDDQRSSGDEYRNSEDEDSDKSIAIKNKRTKLRKKKKSIDVPSKKSQAKPESVAKRKTRPRKTKKAQLVDKSHERLGYKRVYECHKCGYLCKSFSLVHTHLDKMHSIVLESVEEYEEVWDQERKARGIQDCQEDDKVSDAEMLDKKNLTYKCIECPHRNADYEMIKKHIVEQHREAKFIRCAEEDCQYSTHDSCRFASHMKLMHRNKHSYSCKECDYKTHSKSVLELHHTTKHLNIKPFACQQCTKEFVSKASLQNHVAMRHEKNTKFTCPTCSKSFYLKRYLKEHMTIHLGLKPHICEHCGKAFTKIISLEKHVFTSHTSQESNVPCPQCSFKAKNVYSLQFHITRIHGERTQHYCDFCGKCFYSKLSLKAHIWRHLGSGPYKCPTCSTCCNNNHHLKRHMMKHTGERPYHCDVCDYRASTKNLLKLHTESHLNELKYKCTLCPYSANRKSSLNRHIRLKCGTLTRKYTPSKNKAAFNFRQSNTNLAEDVSGPSTNVIVDVKQMETTP